MLKKIILLFMALAVTSCGDDNNDASFESGTSRLVDRKANSFDVTKKFGKLNVHEGEYSYETEAEPWSSWWFPSKDKDLFIDEHGRAPLEKYDEFVLLQHDQFSKSAHYEENSLYNPLQAPWAGLCHAWAVASLLHREPSRVLRKRGMEFSVSDQKALLLKSYENVSGLEIYGQRYDGLNDNDFQDIYPDQFHRAMEHYLRDENLPFIMDYDASYPVWTVPVYKAKTNIEKIDSQTMAVTTWVTYASPFVDENFVGTRKIVKTYNYNLYGESKNGSFEVVDSEWTESSVHDHPDYVIGYPKDAQRGSYNTELKINHIDEILKR